MLSVPRRDTAILEEHFADSLHIGRRQHNKVDVSSYSRGDSDYTIIKFYSKTGKSWSLTQRIRLNKNDALPAYPKIDDLNHDGYGDLTCISMQAARGANEVRRL